MSVAEIKARLAARQAEARQLREPVHGTPPASAPPAPRPPPAPAPVTAAEREQRRAELLRQRPPAHYLAAGEREEWRDHVSPNALFNRGRCVLMNVRMPRYELAPVTIARMANSKTCGSL